MMKKKGFTLVELIIAMAAVSAVSLMTWVLFGPVDNWFFTQRRRAGFAESSGGMTRILKEVRRVKAPDQISTFTPDHFVFTDIDDNAVDFELSETNLKRNDDVLARNVVSDDDNPIFSYLDKDGNVATAVDVISVVKVRLVTTSGITLESAARIRNP